MSQPALKRQRSDSAGTAIPLLSATSPNSSNKNNDPVLPPLGYASPQQPKHYPCSHSPTPAPRARTPERQRQQQHLEDHLLDILPSLPASTLQSLLLQAALDDPTGAVAAQAEAEHVVLRARARERCGHLARSFDGVVDEARRLLGALYHQGKEDKGVAAQQTLEAIGVMVRIDVVDAVLCGGPREGRLVPYEIKRGALETMRAVLGDVLSLVMDGDKCGVLTALSRGGGDWGADWARVFESMDGEEKERLALEGHGEWVARLREVVKEAKCVGVFDHADCVLEELEHFAEEGHQEDAEVVNGVILGE